MKIEEIDITSINIIEPSLIYFIIIIIAINGWYTILHCIALFLNNNNNNNNNSAALVGEVSANFWG
jgi:hypothetical protein